MKSADMQSLSTALLRSVCPGTQSGIQPASGKKCSVLNYIHILPLMTLWRNGSASDSRSEGCVFNSRQGHTIFFYFNFFNYSLDVFTCRKCLQDIKTFSLRTLVATNPI